MPVMFYELRASARRGRQGQEEGGGEKGKAERGEEGDYERRGKIQPVKLRKGYLTGNSDSHWVKGPV